MDGLVLKEVVLTKERTSIGRKPHNDLVIDNLAVSGEHAVIVTILADSFLEDLGSTNGTFVNGQPIKKHFLQGGDVIELGKYKLKYISDAPAPMSPSEFDKTLVLRSPPMRTHPNGASGGSDGDLNTDVMATNEGAVMSSSFAGAPTLTSPSLGTAEAATKDLGQTASMLSLSPPAGSVEGAPPSLSPRMLPSSVPADQVPKAKMRIISGPNNGRELVLTKALTTLGRPGVQVAVITRRPQGYFVTHVEGAHFPVVNERLLGSEAHPLVNGDVLELSGTRMEFKVDPIPA
jgi:pSer/pThr/pTyr-binding forkhead associated (FHA) protein